MVIAVATEFGVFCLGFFWFFFRGGCVVLFFSLGDRQIQKCKKKYCVPAGALGNKA